MYSKVITKEMRDKKRDEGSILQFTKYHGVFLTIYLFDVCFAFFQSSTIFFT